jgi:hypothetical protein
MGVISLVLILIALGVVLQLLRPRVDQTIYSLVLVIIILAVCLAVLNWFGIWGGHRF